MDIIGALQQDIREAREAYRIERTARAAIYIRHAHYSYASSNPSEKMSSNARLI
jgi:hypothetical protein